MESCSAAFSLFISTTGERVFQTGRAVERISSHYVCSVHYMEKKFIITLVHFIQIVLPLLLYEYKDQSLVKRTYTIIFVLRIEFSTIPAHFKR